MSADTGNPMPWYQPPTATQPPQPWPWPRDLVFGAETPSPWAPGSYPARLGQAEDDAPTLYYPDVLSALAGPLDDGVLQQLSEALAPLGMSIARGPDFRDGSEVTLVLSAAAGAPDAWQALHRLRSIRGTSTLGPAASAAVDGLALRRLYLTGMPAKDGHSGNDRAAVTLLAVPPRTDPSRVPGGRRPVVAVIDSGVGRHPWLDGTARDPFWLDAPDLQWKTAPPGPSA